MAKRKKSVPSYRLHRQSGQAVVTLSCAFTGKRRDYLLGEYDTAESRAEYARKLAEWEEAGRVLDQTAPAPVKRVSAVTVGDVMVDWWADVLGRYGVSDPLGRLPSRLYAQRSVVKLTRATCGSMPATQFGPLALQNLRQKMVEQGWSRGHVNSCIATVIRAFKRAVSQEVVGPDAIVALECVKPLRRGELGAREGQKITQVPVADVEAVKPYLSRQVRAIVDVMLLTGARCGEVVMMRPIDIEVGKVWTYRPTAHKTEHIGHERMIHIGPRCQTLIKPFIADRPVDAYLFSPAEAVAEQREQRHADRTTPAGYGNHPGTNRAASPKRHPRDHYTTDSVRKAVWRACDEAFPPPPELARQRVETNKPTGPRMRWETEREWRQRLGKAKWAELSQWRQDHRWSPHQVRKTAATLIRKEAGAEAAAIILGHSSAKLTDEVYGERDYVKATETIAKLG